MPGPADLPSFDRAVMALLGLAGVGGTVLAVVGFAFAVQSWLGGARLLAGGARQAGGAARRVARIGPVAGILAVVVTILVPLAQVLCLGLCYLGGNLMSMIVDGDREARGHRLAELFAEHGAGALWPWRLANGLELDRIAGTYVAISAVCLLLSYRFARRGRYDDGILELTVVLGVPALLTLALAVLAIVVLVAVALLRLAWLLLNEVFADAGFGEWAHDQIVFVPVLGVALLCLLYVGSCYAALAAPRIVFAVWRERQVVSSAG